MSARQQLETLYKMPIGEIHRVLAYIHFYEQAYTPDSAMIGVLAAIGAATVARG